MIHCFARTIRRPAATKRRANCANLRLGASKKERCLEREAALYGAPKWLTGANWSWSPPVSSDSDCLSSLFRGLRLANSIKADESDCDSSARRSNLRAHDNRVAAHSRLSLNPSFQLDRRICARRRKLEKRPRGAPYQSAARPRRARSRACRVTSHEGARCSVCFRSAFLAVRTRRESAQFYSASLVSATTTTTSPSSPGETLRRAPRELGGRLRATCATGRRARNANGASASVVALVIISCRWRLESAPATARTTTTHNND